MLRGLKIYIESTRRRAEWRKRVLRGVNNAVIVECCTASPSLLNLTERGISAVTIRFMRLGQYEIPDDGGPLAQNLRAEIVGLRRSKVG